LEKNKKRKILNEFLGALGAIKIDCLSASDNKISGTVFYDLGDSDEKKKFGWHMTGNNIPSEEVYRLAKLIKDESIPRDELLIKFNRKYFCELEKSVFDSIF